jgi:hypothetical protein
VPTRWLPPEHDGPRTPAEAVDDLRIIAASGPLSDAHVVMEPTNGEPLGGRGAVTLRECPGTAAFVVEVAGETIAQLDPSDVQSSHLRTYDDADYYILVIETAAGKLHVSDAYND